MENKSFCYNIIVNASAAEVIKKICEVQSWWGVTFEGACKMQGDEFIIRMGGESFFNFTVSELVPGKKITWKVTDCYMPWYEDKNEWSGTQVVFDLSEANGQTTVDFTHEGLTPLVACYKDCKPGWTHWIGTSLLSYVNTGIGNFKQP